MKKMSNNAGLENLFNLMRNAIEDGGQCRACGQEDRNMSEFNNALGDRYKELDGNEISINAHWIIYPKQHGYGIGIQLFALKDGMNTFRNSQYVFTVCKDDSSGGFDAGVASRHSMYVEKYDEASINVATEYVPDTEVVDASDASDPLNEMFGWVIGMVDVHEKWAAGMHSLRLAEAAGKTA